jgi:hypothetical protein
MFKRLRRSRVALVGVCCALVGAAAVPVVGWATISGSTGDGPMVLQSGLTNLTYEAKSNVSSISPNGTAGVWMRVGDSVEMSGNIPVTPTTAGASTAVYIPLPVDSNINQVGTCVGTGNVSWPSYTVARVYGSTTTGHTHQCVIEWNPSSTGLQYVGYSLTYRVSD